MRYLIHFSYDGTSFYGYQKQPGLRTVEDEFEKALYNINNHTKTKIVASGRTDAGVHALCQTAHFDLSIQITLYKLKCALNSLLPDDIHVISVKEVNDEFHARFMVAEKTYKYLINCGEYNPLERNYSFQYNKKLDINIMKDAIKLFNGTHNFKNFVSDECIKDNYERIITKTDIFMDGNNLVILFTGNGFMKYQVRNMVGTLIKIGALKLPVSIIYDIFNDEKKKKFVYTAPACGLYLVNVKYDNKKTLTIDD